MSAQSNRELEIFNSALERVNPAERATYLDGACGEDSEMRARIETLLRAHDAAGGFLLANDPKSPAAAPPKTIVMTPDMFPVTERPGDRIGRYKLREKIGEGGCGVVYVADQEQPVRRRVALKVIKLGMDTTSVIARFEAERQALAMMDHPNIAKVLDAGATDAGRPYFVMELVRGIRITDYCDQNKLSTSERLDLFIKVCHAVQHAHQKGIIHRDLKPSNVLVTLHDGVPVPKIIDFGISKATEGRLTDLTVYTELNQFIGTPAYMSPEQAEMSGLDIDTRSDIYSLGVLLYELLTGGTPFDAQELVKSGLDAMRKTIREREPVRPSTKLNTMLDSDLTAVALRHGAEPPKLVHLIKGDLDWIVMKSLEKDRTRRYETANGLAADIKRHLGNEPIIARPPSNLYRFQKMARRNKLAFAATAAIAASLLLGIAFSSWQAVRAMKSEKNERAAQVAADESRLHESEQRQVAQQERSNAVTAQAEAESQRNVAKASEQNARSLLYAADMRLAQQAWDDGNLSRMNKLLEAHRPEPGQADERGFEYYYLQNLAKGEQEQVLSHDTNGEWGVAISPDGKWLATATIMEGRLWDLASRKLIAVIPNAGSFILDHGAFSFDSQYLLIGSTNGAQLYCIPTRQTRSLASEKIIWGMFSPTTNLLACNKVKDFTSPFWYGAATGRVWDYLADKEITKIDAKFSFCWSPDGSRLFTGLYERNLISWKTTDWSCAQTNKFPAIIQAVDITSDGKLMAASDWQGMVYLVDTANGRKIGTILSGDVRSDTLAISPDGKLLATGSGNDAIRIWDVTTRQLVRQFRGHTGKITTLAFTHDGQTLVSNAQDGDVRLWNLAHPAGEFKMTNYIGGFGWQPPQYSPEGQWMVLQTNAHNAVILDSSNLQISATIAGEAVSFSPDDKQLAILVDSNQLGVLTIGTFSNRANIYLQTTFTTNSYDNCLQLTPDGTFFAFAIQESDFPGVNCPQKLFEAATGREIQSTNVMSYWSPSSCFLPDNRTWIYLDGSQIKFFELQSRTNTRSLECNSRVDFLVVSSDGKTLAASTDDYMISVWDLKSGTRIRTLAGHRAIVASLAFSPDGRTLASGSEDRTVKLWHVATGRELASFTQEGGVYWLTFSPDNQMLVSGGIGSYQFWRAPRGDDAAPMPVVRKISMADLPTNSIWRLPDGYGMNAPGAH